MSYKRTKKSKVKKMSDFAIVESLFSRLLPALNGVFSVSEIAEVSEFVDVGEYGLALDDENGGIMENNGVELSLGTN